MIYTCVYETCFPSHSYGPVVRSGYLIHYILKGKGIYKTDGHIYQLKEGDAFLIRPNTLIYYEADKYDPWTYTWIGFQGIKISYVEEALRYIENNYAHEVNIHVIADYLNIERTYLYRLFKDITGTSPQEYLLDYRIRRACSLLRETDLPVSDIARSVGYNDALYFSRLFKQKKGRTPTQYRKERAPA